MSLFGTGTAAKYWAKPVQDNELSGPITISCWIKNLPPSSNGNPFGIAQFETGSLQLGLGTYGGRIYFQNYQGGSTRQVNFNIPTTLSGGSWAHLLFTDNNSNSTVGSAINGVSTGTTTASLPTPNWTRFAVGVNTPNNVGMPTTTSIAEVAIWRGITLDPASATRLYQGESPLNVVPANLVDYWPLRGDLANLGPSRYGLQPVGGAVTVWGDHPQVRPARPQRRIYLAVSNPVNALAASPAGTSAATAALTTAIPLAAAPAGMSSATAALATAIQLATSAAAASSATGGLTSAIALAAIPAAASSAAAALTTSIPLAASPAATSNATAALTSGSALAATATAASSATANLTTAISLAAAVTATSNLSATIAGTTAALAAAASAASSATASLTTAIPLAAAAVGSSSATAALAGGIPLAAAPAASSAATAALSTSIRLAVAATGTATATATLAALGVPLAASATASTSATAALTTGSGISASAVSGSSASAALTTSIRLSSSAVGSSVLIVALNNLAPAFIGPAHKISKSSDGRVLKYPRF